MTDRLHAAARTGVEAKQALAACEPYMRRASENIYRAWIAEPDPAKREEAWRLVRAMEIVMATMRQDVVSGEQAAAELAYLAQQKDQT